MFFFTVECKTFNRPLCSDHQYFSTYRAAYFFFVPSIKSRALLPFIASIHISREEEKSSRDVSLNIRHSRPCHKTVGLKSLNHVDDRGVSQWLLLSALYIKKWRTVSLRKEIDKNLSFLLLLASCLLLWNEFMFNETLFFLRQIIKIPSWIQFAFG